MISLVTVNYKSFSQIQNLWESLSKSEFQEFELIILDNSCEPSEVLQFENFFGSIPQVCYLKLAKNLGFGGGNMEGIRFAQGNFLVFVNPDVEVFPETLGVLLKNFEPSKKNVGIIAPVLFNPDKTLQKNWRKFPTVLDLISRRTLRTGRNDDLEVPKENFSVDWVQGSFLFMRKDFLQNTLQGFDPRFFLFMEDIDLCQKCHRAGFEILVIPNAKAIHQPNRLSGGIFYRAVFKKTFWLHLVSAGKYFWKYWRQ